MNGPFFSVVICTFNRADVVGGAVRSVLGQHFDDFELLVADDGSADDRPVIPASFGDARIIVRRGLDGVLSAHREQQHRLASQPTDPLHRLERLIVDHGTLLAKRQLTRLSGALGFPPSQGAWRQARRCVP